jgi:hypothetical protein
MRLTIPEGMAPAAVHDATSKQFLCRDCAYAVLIVAVLVGGLVVRATDRIMRRWSR